MKKILILLFVCIMLPILSYADFKRDDSKPIYTLNSDNAGNQTVTDIYVSSVIYKTLYVSSSSWTTLFSSATESTVARPTLPHLYIGYYNFTSSMTSVVMTNTDNNRVASQSFPLTFPDQIVTERSYRGNRYLRLLEGTVGTVLINVELNYMNRWW